MSFISSAGSNGVSGGSSSAAAAGSVLGDPGSAAGFAGQIGAMTGMPGAGLLGGATKAVQLAQAAMSLAGKTPSAMAEMLNSGTGAQPQLTQQYRFVRIDTPLGDDVLLVNAMVADEYVSQLPEIHLDLLSHRNDIAIEQIVGQNVRITMDPQGAKFNLTQVVSSPAQGSRYFTGFVASFGRVGNSGTVTRYEMTVVPWFWFLTRSTDCRIFQNQDVQAILTSIFHEFGFPDFSFDIRVKRPALKYIVMYQESYYNFCARLMEQEGLWWTFRHEKDRQILVIADTNSGFPKGVGLTTIPYYADSAASEYNGIDRWDEAFSFRVGKITFRDYNHATPSSALMHVEAPTETLKNPNIGNTERYEYRSLYDDGDSGQRYARYAMEAEETQAHRFDGGGYAWAMTTEGRFTLTNHPVSAWNNKEFVVLHVRHEAVNDFTRHANEKPYRNTFTCLPFEVPFRPERRAPRPVIHGTQAAMVVGPKGEEIYTDGSCVKLHFIWDRRGRLDGSDSMWVRVSQPWAGKGWGGSAIPRIGQEVVVAFNEGDPDNPIIIGRVFNGDSANPYHGTSGQTMGIRSQTHKGAGFNELRFSDVNGAQEVFLHAQKDLKTVIKDNETHTVESGARAISLLKGSETKQVMRGGLTETIALTRDTTANVINTKAIAGKAGPGMQSHQASDGIEHRVGESIVTMTPDSIKLTHGPASILINASGIYIDGPVIHLNKGSVPTPEEALALQWAQMQALISKGLASSDPATRAAAAKLAASVKAQQLAKLADHVYHPNDPPPTGWKAIGNDPEALKAFGLKPGDLQIPGSNFGAQMYAPDPTVFGDSMKPTIAFKGTQQLVGEDMANNLDQGLGAGSPYYQKAVSIGTKLQLADTASDVDFTGHSLGGGLASAAAESSGASAVTFNPAGLNPSTVAQYGGTIQPANITAYQVDGDILTGLQKGTLGPISDATAQVMPQAVGNTVTIPGESITTVGRHMMGNVSDGLSRQVATDEFNLTSQLN